MGEQNFETVKAQLNARGMSMQQGTIVNAILIAAASSTKNKAGKRDPEMHQTKKGNQWYYGMKVHVGVDKDSGLIHSVVTTAANVHDFTPAAQLLHGDEKVVYGDASYQGIAKRPEMEGAKAEFRVAMRPGRRRALRDILDLCMQDIGRGGQSHVHAKVEHPFRLIKQQFGFQKTRLRGLVKNQCKINVWVALTNLFMARRQLLAIG